MKKLSEKEKALHEEFSKYGANALEWMRKCVLMLPQIEQNRIWKKKGFGSIYEYAAKLAGMSRHKVEDSLRILRKISDKPELMKVAKVKGLNAVRPVAIIATVESDKFFAEKAAEMSVNTLVTYAKDYKIEQQIAEEKSRDVTGSPTNNGSNKPKSFQISMKLDAEVMETLKKIKGVGDWNDTMKKLLDLNRGEIEAIEEKQKEDKKNKEKLRAELEAEKPKSVRSNNHKAPATIEKYIKKRSGGKCEHPNCKKEGENIHHMEPFALTKKHDPDRMLHLCKGHHQIIHLGYIDDGEIQTYPEMETKADMALEFEETQRKRWDQWKQIEKLESYDIKNLINGRVAEFR